MLKKTYEKVKYQIEEKLQKNDFVRILTDGWSNIKNEAIIYFIFTTPDPIHYKSVATKTNRQTSEYMAEEISKVIEDIDKKKVLGIVTDNASNIKKAWEIFNEKYQVFIFMAAQLTY